MRANIILFYLLVFLERQVVESETMVGHRMEYENYENEDDYRDRDINGEDDDDMVCIPRSMFLDSKIQLPGNNNYLLNEIQASRYVRGKRSMDSVSVEPSSLPEMVNPIGNQIKNSVGSIAEPPVVNSNIVEPPVNPEINESPPANPDLFGIGSPPASPVIVESPVNPKINEPPPANPDLIGLTPANPVIVESPPVKPDIAEPSPVKPDTEQPEKNDGKKKRKNKHKNRGPKPMSPKAFGRGLVKAIHAVETVADSGALGPQAQLLATAAQLVEGAAKGESGKQLLGQAVKGVEGVAMGGGKMQMAEMVAGDMGAPVPPMAASSGTSGGGSFKQQLMRTAGNQAVNIAVNQLSQQAAGNRGATPGQPLQPLQQQPPSPPVYYQQTPYQQTPNQPTPYQPVFSQQIPTRPILNQQPPYQQMQYQPQYQQQQKLQTT